MRVLAPRLAMSSELGTEGHRRVRAVMAIIVDLAKVEYKAGYKDDDQALKVVDC